MTRIVTYNQNDKRVNKRDFHGNGDCSIENTPENKMVYKLQSMNRGTKISKCRYNVFVPSKPCGTQEQ